MKKLTESEQGEYAALAARAENAELKPIGNPVHGEDAATAGRARLIEATGASSLKEVTQVALGRPRLGEEGRAETKTWKVRAPGVLDQGVRAGARQRGMTVSEYIRFAVAQQVEADSRASGSKEERA